MLENIWRYRIPQGFLRQIRRFAKIFEAGKGDYTSRSSSVLSGCIAFPECIAGADLGGDLFCTKMEVRSQATEASLCAELTADPCHHGFSRSNILMLGHNYATIAYSRDREGQSNDQAVIYEQCQFLIQNQFDRYPRRWIAQSKHLHLHTCDISVSIILHSQVSPSSTNSHHAKP